MTADPGRDRLLAGLRDLRDGNFRRRLAVAGPDAELAAVFNELADREQHLSGGLAERCACPGPRAGAAGRAGGGAA